MLQMESIEKRYRANPRVDALKNELMEYQLLKEQVGEVEARLEEYCTAIEEFGLACTPPAQQDERLIYCRAQSYTPIQLLQQARQTSDLLEQTSQKMVAARGRVLSKILAETDDMAQYQAIRFACVDLPEQIKTGHTIADCITL